MKGTSVTDTRRSHYTCPDKESAVAVTERDGGFSLALIFALQEIMENPKVSFKAYSRMVVI